jgi:hypothetical protein
MTCPHAESTTLLWIYGEGPEDHTDHVAQCADCQSVLDTHETVAFHMSETPMGRALSVTKVPETPEPANSGWGSVLFGLGGIGLAVAALALAWIGIPNLGGISDGLEDFANHVTVPDETTPDDRAPDSTTPKNVLTPDPKQVQVAVHWDFDGFSRRGMILLRP